MKLLTVLIASALLATAAPTFTGKTAQAWIFEDTVPSLTHTLVLDGVVTGSVATPIYSSDLWDIMLHDDVLEFQFNQSWPGTSVIGMALSVSLVFEDSSDIPLYLKSACPDTASGCSYGFIDGTPSAYIGWYGIGFSISDAVGAGTLYTFEFSDIKPTPEPASFALLGVGLVGLTVFARRRQHASGR